MCGIAGWVGGSIQPQERRQAVDSMCGAIVHRGPDDQGIWVGPGVGLGMRRLSIIDVAGGHQPVSNEDDSVRVVFNGEIYNYRPLRQKLERAGHTFQTRSDTEVLVHLYEEYGHSMVDHLRGMFAFAIWDEAQSGLFVARDRLGIKPLSYWEGDHGVAFCSELRSLLALEDFPATVDRSAVGQYLAFGYVPEPQSIFAGVKKLPPGHSLWWSAGQPAQVKQYWDPTSFKEEAVSIPEAREELLRIVDDSVACRLESEVPLGAFLSGGVDSSAVTAIMAKHLDRKVQTFAIGFAEKLYNEADDAAAVAETLGTTHTDVIVSPDVDDIVDGIVGIFDEPFADSSAIPTYLVSRLAREQVTVVLSGDGGDELFGGYVRYHKTMRRGELPRFARQLAGGVGRIMPHGWYGRNYLLDRARGIQGQYANQVVLPQLASEGGLAAPDVAASVGPIDSILDPYFDLTRGRDFGTQMTQVDIMTYLPGDILTKVDRASMAVSLEARVPLLDHNLVEFAMRLPGAAKFDAGQGKKIFREAITSLVPPRVLTKPKQGFAIPLAEWFRGPLGHRVEALLRPDNGINEYVRPEAVARIAGEHQAGRRDHSSVLWRLLVLSVWLGHLRNRSLSNPVSLGAVA